MSVFGDGPELEAVDCHLGAVEQQAVLVLDHAVDFAGQGGLYGRWSTLPLSGAVPFPVALGIE